MESTQGLSLIEHATQFIIQLSVIITIAWASEVGSRKISFPKVVGYIIVGIVIGPFLLGGIPLGTLFPNGLFMAKSALSGSIPENIEYISIIASVILLFISGLETNVSLFLRYITKASVIGVSEIIVSFVGGYAVGLIFFPGLSMLHPTYLFLGTITTATSVGITTSILSNRRKVSSPEGVTILSASILDDVVGIIILAILTGIAEISASGSEAFHVSKIIKIALKALLLWMGSTVIGIVFARRFGKGLKLVIKDKTRLSVFVLGIAFLVGGLFEAMGISMLIGAYVVGLTFSNTDLSYVIQEKLTSIVTLFVPIFFIVSGMSLDVYAFASLSTLLFGLTYSAISIASKFLGAGTSAYFLGFTPLGAARVGSGMTARGEVSLIVASIGLSSGVLSNTAYSAVMMMVVLTSFFSSIALNLLLNVKGHSTKKKEDSIETKIEINLEHSQLTGFVVADLLTLMENEEFFISKMTQFDRDIYHIRRDTIFITLHAFKRNPRIVFYTDKNSIPFVKTALYEVITNIAEAAQLIKANLSSAKLAAIDAVSKSAASEDISLEPYMSPNLVILSLKSNTKEEILQELIKPLEKGEHLSNAECFLKDIFDREKTISTGMQNGIALPHARSTGCKELKIVVGLKPKGVDFDSLDSLPSTIFILMAIPPDFPHLSILAKIGRLLNKQKFREALLFAGEKTKIIDLFVQ